MALFLHDNDQEKRNGVLTPLWNFLSSFDYVQIVGALILMSFGLIFIHSTGIQTGATGNWVRQLVWMVFGTGLFFIAANFDYRYFQPLAPVIYGIGLILLIIVLFSPPINNARSWLRVPGFDIRLQPSELAKIATIIFISAILSSPRFNIKRFRNLFIPIFATIVPMWLIIVEPDFGSAFVLLPICGAMIFVAGIKYRIVITTILLAVIILPLVVLNEVKEYKPLLKPYQRARITTFLDPNIDPHGSGYNLRQARLAVGSGGFLGKGIGQGTLSGLGYLPQAVTNNDFIFSVIAEESGFLGVSILLFAEFILVFSCLRIAFLTPDPFGRYIAVGMAALLFCHNYVNIGMCIGLAPISGIPLPLVSFGGSFMAMNLGALGILQSIYRYRKEDL